MKWGEYGRILSRNWYVRGAVKECELEFSYEQTSSNDIAVFPILADVVEVKKGSRSTAHWSNDFIRLNGWLRNSFAQLITPLDIDSIGQNWEDSNNKAFRQLLKRPVPSEIAWMRPIVTDARGASRPTGT